MRQPDFIVNKTETILLPLTVEIKMYRVEERLSEITKNIDYHFRITSSHSNEEIKTSILTSNTKIEFYVQDKSSMLESSLSEISDLTKLCAERFENYKGITNQPFFSKLAVSWKYMIYADIPRYHKHSTLDSNVDDSVIQRISNLLGS
jgi:hypothetical protein